VLTQDKEQKETAG